MLLTSKWEPRLSHYSVYTSTPSEHILLPNPSQSDTNPSPLPQSPAQTVDQQQKIPPLFHSPGESEENGLPLENTSKLYRV